MKQELRLNYIIKFGKYRNMRLSLKEIIDSGISGAGWARWIQNKSGMFKLNDEALKHLEKKENEYRSLLQQK